MRRIWHIDTRMWRPATAAAVLVWCAAVGVRGESRLPLICDRTSAQEWCDTSALTAVEGVWEYPDDNVTVVIRRMRGGRNVGYRMYDISVVSTPDCSMSPGESIGTLEETAEAGVYTLSLYSRRKRGRLSGLLKCAAKLGRDGENLIVKAPKIGLKLRLNGLTVLPRFWRSVRVKVDNPAEELPTGMVRVYPSYDGNGSRRRDVRYL